MRYIELFVVLLLIVFCFGCKKEGEKNVPSLNRIAKTVSKENKIIITGTSDDIRALRFINLMNDGYLFGRNHKNTKRTFVKDSIHMEVDSIYKPQSFDLHIFGDSAHYSSIIFLSPGDTLSFKIKEKELQFTGKNAAYNNFFIALEKTAARYRYNPYKGDIQEYKKSVRKIYDERVLFFNQYLNKNNISSKEQIDLIKDILKFEYLSCLINPKSVYVESMDWYVSTSDGVLSLMTNEFANEEQIFDLKDYLDGITINDFKRPDLLANSVRFKDTFDAFIRYYFAKTDHLNYSKEAFLAQKEFIQKNFEGNLEHYAIARMIREYNVRGFGYSKENIKTLKNVIMEYDDVFSSKPTYKEKMDDILESLDNFNFKLSDAALDLTKLVNPIGDTVTLRDIFNKANQKIKVIDFWASWCPPCIREIKQAKQFKNKLSNEEHVVWVYLSIDKDQKKWLNSINELQEYLNTEHQYIIAGGKNSSLGKALKVNGIPRYVIFDKEEQIVLDNAPRPSDNLIFKKVIDKINEETN